MVKEGTRIYSCIQFSLYNPQQTAFITEDASVHCAVRPGHLNKMDYISSLNG